MKAIVAVTNGWGIGYKGSQLVTLPVDRRFFKEVTTGSVVIMGRKTFEDLPDRKPLPGRLNVVISHSFSFPGVLSYSSPEQACELVRGDENAFVIGGGSIYRQLLKFCDTVFVTKIHLDAKYDVTFPNLDRLIDWSLSSILQSGEENGISYEICLYKRLCAVG